MSKHEQDARAKLAEIERLKAEFPLELLFDGELQAELNDLKTEFRRICEQARRTAAA